MGNSITNAGSTLLYENDEAREVISVLFQDKTFWLTQRAMAELVDCSADNISLQILSLTENSQNTWREARDDRAV